MDFETRAIHEGQEPDPATGAVTVPIYQTSTYVQDAVGEHRGYEYSRVANPTRTALQLCLGSLESAEHGVAFGSGMAAVTTVMHLVHPNERIVSVNDVYGGVCWLVLRGIKTLAVRMRQHCENARRIAAFLDSHNEVERVLYPGLPSHPGHEIAGRQMRDYGAMISFLASSEEEAVELVARTAIW